MEQKPELQPVHRIFLGELFVFIVFFAGAMSILVGPMGRPVGYSALLVGAGAVVSGFAFLWFAFVTPTKRDEPRYGFMILSLLPTLAMSPVFVLVATYAAQSMDLPTSPPPAKRAGLMKIVIVDIQKSGPNRAQLGGEDATQRASVLFADEIAALDEELAKLGFVDRGFKDATIKTFVRLGAEREVAVETTLAYEVTDVSAPGKYSFFAALSNSKPGSPERYFSDGDKWPNALWKTLSEEWDRNMEVRRKARKK